MSLIWNSRQDGQWSAPSVNEKFFYYNIFINIDGEFKIYCNGYPGFQSTPPTQLKTLDLAKKWCDLHEQYWSNLLPLISAA